MKDEWTKNEIKLLLIHPSSLILHPFMNKRLNIGEQLGEYRITGFLGAGGMGEVYAGEHAKLGRRAAIKILGAASTDESFKARFFNEARLQASLHHPHVAALYDFQEIGGQLCIFMEYVDGESLEDLVKRRAFAVEDALQTFAAICEAIAYVHANGIVHRDIKSQNVKLAANGTIKMLDFGIAKASAAPEKLTQTGGVIGTPHYLAPEQLSGKNASPQTDVWALGILLYEMLTGETPFNADTLASLCYQITMQDAPAPESLNPVISKQVSKIVHKCLKKNPAERYQSANEILSDVRKVLNGEKSSTVSLGKTFGFFKNETKVQNNSASIYHNDSYPAPKSYSSENYESNDHSKNYPAQNAKKGLPIGLIAGLVAAAVVILFFGGGIAIYFLRGSSPAVVKGNTNGNQAVVVSNGQLKRVKIDVDEGKAQILRDGAALGQTPYDLDAKDGEKVNLILRRDGYEDKNVQLEVKGSKQVYTFSLKQK